MRTYLRNSLLLCLLFLSACGYHFQGVQIATQGTTITVPYVQGDFEGRLTDELIRSLSVSGMFQPVQNGGTLLLKVSIIENKNERIGWRYDREEVSGKLKKKLIPTESRGHLIAEVSLVEADSNKVLLGPEKVVSDITFDYVNSDSIRELTFITPQGEREKVINFSLGQLDTIEGAQDAATVPIYRHLAQKIIDGIMQTR